MATRGEYLAFADGVRCGRCFAENYPCGICIKVCPFNTIGYYTIRRFRTQAP